LEQFLKNGLVHDKKSDERIGTRMTRIGANLHGFFLIHARNPSKTKKIRANSLQSVSSAFQFALHLNPSTVPLSLLFDNSLQPYQILNEVLPQNQKALGQVFAIRQCAYLGQK
jgi:hypothetical protein